MAYTKDELMKPGREKSGTVHMDHQGRPTPDIAGGKVLARSRNDERGHIERKDEPNIARTTHTAKHVYDLKVHGGMSSQTRGGELAYGGDHASALDSQSGRMTDMTVPYKDGTVGAHPLTAAPIAKQFIGKPVAIHPSMRSRNDDALASEDAGVAHNRHMAKREAIQAAHDALGHAVISDALAARRWDK